jgi:DUF971 family protein
MQGAQPLEITSQGGRQIVIRWDDGHASTYPNPELRWRCSCASCVDEWTGRRQLERARVLDDVRPVSMSLVGNYAIQISWSDGHSTGIYSFDFLRAICPCAACSAARALETNRHDPSGGTE